MKHCFLTLLFFFHISVLFAGNIDVWGQPKAVDTLEYKSVGPGMKYAKMNFSDYPMTVYMLTVDLNNPYNSIETFQANDHLGKTEAMTNAYTRLSSAQRKPIGAINGNFWAVSGQNQPAELLGIPYSGSAINGEMLTEPSSWNRGRTTVPEELLQEIGFAVIDEDRKLWIDDLSFDAKVKIDGVGIFPISQLNRQRAVNKLVFFNRYLGQPTRTDDTGIEVFIKPVVGQKWSVNNDVNCVVTRIIKDKGANVIEEGESVLSGNGTARTFLENLSVGQTVSVNMGIFTSLTNERPKVREMLTGNALVMKNGQLTIRNTNEAYNSTLYPRTGIGMSQDGKIAYLIVIDKMGSSVGANTATMCGILKAAGAWNATSMDGGGSAQMMLDGSIVNKPADGKERAVANGWMLFQNAPVDNVISRLEFADYKVDVPVFASYKPVILGYNQYGVLVNPDVQGFSLTCTPGLGQTDANANFVASGVAQTGALTVSLNNITVSKQVNVLAADIQIRLDSVLLDQRREYPIEVLSKVGTKTMSIAPAALDWKIENESVCEIRNGVLKGLSNGETRIFGSLGEFKDTLKVKVQTYSVAEIVHENFSELNKWELTSSLTSWNTTLKTENLPAGWPHGVALNYTYQSTRSPFVKLDTNLQLYSLPDTISVTVNTANVEVSRLIVAIRPNHLTQSTGITFNSLPKAKDVKLSIPVNQLVAEPADLINYPLWIDYLNFYISAGSQTAGVNYNLFIKDITLQYKGMNVSSVIVPENGLAGVYPNPFSGSELTIQLNEATTSALRYTIFDLTGQRLLEGTVSNPANTVYKIPVHALGKGVYMLQLDVNNFRNSVKIIKN